MDRSEEIVTSVDSDLDFNDDSSSDESSSDESEVGNNEEGSNSDSWGIGTVEFTQNQNENLPTRFVLDSDDEMIDNEMNELEHPVTDTTNQSNSPAEVDIAWEKVKNYDCNQLPFMSELKINDDTLTESSTPLEIFTRFLTSQILEEITVQSNRFAMQSFPPKLKLNFKEISKDELMSYFGLFILMGIVHKPSISSYWTQDILLSTPYFAKVMSRDRFKEIHRALHFVDNETVIPGNPIDKFGIVREAFYKNSKDLLTPGENLSLDESLILFKGRLSFLQFCPTKRSRFGIKLFIICDSTTNFVLSSIIYIGDKTSLQFSKKEFGVGGAVVLTLLSDYFNLGHKLYIDNFYNSPKLATELLKNGVNICGTVRKTRKGMPKSQVKLKRGEIEVFVKNELLVQRWFDRREVWALSTGQSHKMELVTNSRNQSSREKPTTIIAYNAHMGKVDNVDRTLKSYDVKRKTLKWYKKIFAHDLDTMIFNSFVIFKKLHPNIKIEFLAFKRNLVDEIVQKHGLHRKLKGRQNLDNVSSVRLNGRHFPEECKNFSNCTLCTRRKKRKQTRICCDVCKVYLCTAPCFKLYHTVKDLKGLKDFEAVEPTQEHNQEHEGFMNLQNSYEPSINLNNSELNA